MDMPKERRWRLKSEVAQNTTVTGSILAKVLENRGITSPDDIRSFLNPSLADLSDPFLMKGVTEAVDRLIAAKRTGEIVCIHGDYDVDGVSAVALLTAFFRAVAIPVCYVIPKRLEDGYGLSTDGVDEAVRLGAKVLITVDCGITSVNEAAYCLDRGIDLIITDHHTPGELLPSALAVINPLQPGCAAPFNKLAGVGLAFKLAMAIRSRMRAEGYFDSIAEPNLREYLDLAALGTIADLVPLVGENRVIAAFGLKELSARRRIGINALKAVSSVNGDVTAGDVGFRLAPRLNASGRLDDAKRGVELLLTSEIETADALADELDSANSERQQIEKEILADALERLQSDSTLNGRTAIVMASDSWHPGVIGIVASRVVERYFRPTVLIALQNGIGKGSGRSIPVFHLYKALAASSEHLLNFGGHQQAAGLTISEDKLNLFYGDFDSYAAAMLSEEDLVPQINVDAEISVAGIDESLLEEINQLRPFGMGNPEPVFLVRGLEIADSRVLKDAHLKLRLKKDGKVLDAIGFNMAKVNISGNMVDILFTVDRNEWNGRVTMQLKLKDIRSSDGA
ncbi:MAG: single-stranded-DNA-specific exonuclease RecJ [Geobacteraceae bacterium]|nr:single-stranded-DNA-specific exonuclease RecJ [Geobacteraceae bacterium]